MDTMSHGNFVPTFSKPRTDYLVLKTLGQQFKDHFINGTFNCKDYGSQNIFSRTVCFGTSHHLIVRASVRCVTEDLLYLDLFTISAKVLKLS